MSSSTFAANVPGDLGGGAIIVAGGSLTLANSILEDNGNRDLDDLMEGAASFPPPGESCGNICNGGGDLLGYYNDSAVNPLPTVLAALGNYGGPTPTMIPLPGSPAICAGTAVSGGGLTLPASDQRGDPRTNTSYSGYSSSSPCVDSGAVQTNYSMAFSTDPEPLSGASEIDAETPFEAAVTLDESGVPFGSTVTPSADAPSVTIPLALTGNGTLTGGSAGTAADGVASYSLLRVSEAGSDDTLTANLTMNIRVKPVPTLSAESASFSVEQATPVLAALTSPAAGSTLSSTSATTFTWTAGTEVSAYWLFLGSTGPGTSDLYASPRLTGFSTTAGPFPSSGGTIYATLISVINGAWQPAYYTFLEPGTPAKATVTSPAAGSILSSTTATTFTWTTGTGVSAYWLTLGTTGTGSSDLYASPRLTGLSTTAGPFPANGGMIYATLYSVINGVWQAENYTFVESGTAAPATMASPASGSTLSSTASTTFTWTTGTGVSAYWLRLGTTGPGSFDLYESGRMLTLTDTVGPLPANGKKIYATLYSVIDGVWRATTSTYTESGP